MVLCLPLEQQTWVIKQPLLENSCEGVQDSLCRSIGDEDGKNV
jgi:hypothetical protein